MATAQTPVPNLRLSDGIAIPQLGFGVFQAPPKETQSAIEQALTAGFRHIDTSTAYGNEEHVGAALAASGLSREEYFITAKHRSSRPSHDSTLIAFEASLERLGLDHMDLYLIHRPLPADGGFVDVWRTAEQIHNEEAVRTIGVSNFRIEDLELLEQETETQPTINQVELHPYRQSADLRAWHAKHGIATAARNPLGQGTPLAGETMIVRLAESYGKTLTQVILRWHLQLENVVLPQFVTSEQIRENIDIFDFELSHRAMAAIEDLDRGSRIGPRRAAFVAP